MQGPGSAKARSRPKRLEQRDRPHAGDTRSDLARDDERGDAPPRRRLEDAADDLPVERVSGRAVLRR